MDHPAVLNAVNLRMHEQLAEIWDDFEQDEDIGVGVLTGSGDPSFSVGQDLRKPAERNRTEIRKGRPGLSADGP